MRGNVAERINRTNNQRNALPHLFCLFGHLTTRIRNNSANQSLLSRLSEPCNRKIRAVRWKNQRALILFGDTLKDGQTDAATKSLKNPE